MEVASKVIKELLSEENCVKVAVDVGAGQGYLALELLQNISDLSIYAVESSDIQVHGTNARLSAFSQELKILERFHLKQVRLKADDELDSLLFGVRPTYPPYIMYSLHACGSLSECMVESFARPNNGSRVLFNVACCYNLIDEKLPGRHFPLSAAVKNRLKLMRSLTPNMKMVACQAPYRWIHRPENTKKFFKRHFYRSLLELMILEKFGNVSLLNRLGNIGDRDLSSFKDYFKAAWKSFGEHDNPFDDALIDSQYDKNKHLEPVIAFMWTMRAMLGPVTEATILFDRYSFIEEEIGHQLSSISLFPLFDILKSPRNMALIAIKSNPDAGKL